MLGATVGTGVNTIRTITTRNPYVTVGAEACPREGFEATVPRPAALVAVVLATAFTLVASTSLVLLLFAVGPTGIAGVPVVMAGGFVVLTAPTLVWRVGVDALAGATPRRDRATAGR